MPERQVIDISFVQIKNGDIRAYEALFKQMYKPLVNFCYKMVKDRDVAEEIVQEIFTYLWEKRNIININTSLLSYLYSASKNRCINYIKLEAPKKQAEIEIEQIDLEEISRSHQEEYSERLRVIVQYAIDQLPEKCREAFILSRYSGLTYDEIAEEMELSVKTIENQIGIALKKLRVTLKPLIDELKK